MQAGKWQTAELGLLNKRTGELYDAELRLAKKQRGGRFMKLWQGAGWEKQLGGLQGNSLRVLIHLLAVAVWENVVPGPSMTAEAMGLKQPNASKAYTDLAKAGFLCKLDGTYRLNPRFCWKGSDAQYEHVCRELSSADSYRVLTAAEA